MYKYISQMDSVNKIKYYTPCLLPFVTDSILKQNQPIYLSLLENSDLYSVPNYAISENGEPTSNVRYSWKLGYQSILDILKIMLVNDNFNTFDEGISYIENHLNREDQTIVGVTTYYLPYSTNYLSQNYLKSYPHPLFGVSNHIISITGIDLSNNKIKVYDTTPKIFQDWISLELFKLAWMTDRKIKDLEHVKGINKLIPYNYIRVIVSQYFSEEEVMTLSLRLLKTIVYEYLNCRTLSEGNFKYVFGLSSTSILLKELDACIMLKAASPLSKFVNCLVEQKIARYFLRDFVEDISHFFTPLIHYSGEIDKLVYNIDMQISRTSVELSKTYINFLQLSKNIDKLKSIFDIEKILLEKLYLALKDYSTIYKII
ncbi:MAG: hypothetical protein LBS62_11890 [Clostridiales bacterium]|nr:hypothetical protein [Clostridiales bacterium]